MGVVRGARWTNRGERRGTLRLFNTEVPPTNLCRTDLIVCLKVFVSAGGAALFRFLQCVVGNRVVCCPPKVLRLALRRLPAGTAIRVMDFWRALIPHAGVVGFSRWAGG